MKKLFIYTIVFIGIAVNVFAQEKSNKEKKGDKYYFIYDFNKAIDCYKKAKNLTVDGQRKLAKSYLDENKDTLSEIAFAKLINMPGGNTPQDYFDYAMILKDNGKYEESYKYMDKYVEMKPNDLRSKDYVANKSTLAELLKDNNNYAIVHLDLNTDAEDFGTAYYKNKITFASSRPVPKLVERKSNRNGKPYLNMYVSEVEKGELKTPSIFDEKLDLKYNNGPATFNGDGTYMAYTRNNYELSKNDRVVKLEIYFRTYKDNKWSEPEPFTLNNKEYSVGQACLTADGNTMYFTSDMPGGYGGTDIYRIKKDDKGTWGKPENMGDKLNTEGDEMFPFYEEHNGILFFASDGRFGLGGLDIFICWLSNDKADRIYNAGFPLNTSYDDFAPLTDSKASKGYFSSNRKGGSGDDDIYSLDIVKLKGLQVNKQVNGIAQDTSGNAIPNTFITLLNDSNRTLDTVTTKTDGAYTFIVKSDKNFKLIGKKDKYIDGDTTFNTFGKNLAIKADVTLTKKAVATPKMEVGDDLGKVVNIDQSILNQPIYFDLNKCNLRPDAINELDKIVKIMNEYPTMVIELRSYTDCRGTKAYNQALSNKRANTSISYLKKGITKPTRVYGKGYGETNLVNACACEGSIVSDCSEDEHQKNRRTEFIIMKK
jgi:outer membrane protein OmpA-like peptidoglycan-associated protein